MVAFGIVGTLAAFSAGGWKWGAGFFVGALLSGLNFRWLKRLVESLPAPGEVAVHDLFKQEKLLLDWAHTHSTKHAVHTNGLKAHAEPA